MVDLLARLVDVAAWRNLLHMQCDELHAGMEARALRGLRPDSIDALERGFDVDIEAEVLDWLEFHNLRSPEPVLESVRAALAAGGEPERLAMGLWHLADWASLGTWRCMEGRGFLYLEPYSGGDMDGVGPLYEEQTWLKSLQEITNFSSEEYAEKVVLDWMGRRQDLGETLDENRDPRILSTMQSHRRHASALHLFTELVEEDETILLVCREWHSMLNVGWGEFNLGGLLTAALKEAIS